MLKDYSFSFSLFLDIKKTEHVCWHTIVQERKKIVEHVYLDAISNKVDVFQIIC